MSGFNQVLRTVVLAAVVVLGWLGYGEYKGLVDGHRQELASRDDAIRSLQSDVQTQREQLQAKDEAIASLQVDLEASQARVEELTTAVRFLKVDRRRARLSVIGQRQGADGLETTVRFEELGPEGLPLGEPTEVVLPGKLAYVESLVIKFDDTYVEQGDVWRGSSICLFRRLFSENQSPEEGWPLDRAGERPLPYTDDRSPDLVSRLWMRFWDYANDPAAAAAAGVRAIHGEAPFIELRDGSSYLVELRASGGLSLRRE